MAISKRLRFEIFKRDKFTCVYCGATPPALLEIDHIEPRAGGGSDDPSNLVTACKDCNLGKSDRPLDDALPQIRQEAIDELQERVEQIRAYRRWRTEFDDELHLELTAVWQAWIDEFEGYISKEKDGEVFHSPRVDFPSESAVLEYLQDLPTSDVIEAVRIARWKWRKGDLGNHDVARYFCGVCRRKLREHAERNITVTWEELVAQVPDLVPIRQGVADFEPMDAWNFCGERLWESGWRTHFQDGTVHPVASPTSRIEALVGPKSANAHDPTLGSQKARDVALRTVRAALPLCGQTCSCGRAKRPPREEDYPRCEACGQVSAPIDQRESCVPIPVEWEGRAYEPVRYGWEPSLLRIQIAENWTRYKMLKEPVRPTVAHRCPGCHAPLNGFHHPLCSHRACPICGDAPSEGCASRGHRAKAWEISGRQAMARMRRMKTVRLETVRLDTQPAANA